MKFVQPSKIEGVIAAPPSKSIMQRALAASLLASGTTELVYPSYCNDALAAMDIARNLGADIDRDVNRLFITGTGGRFRPRSTSLNCGESGLCMRMFPPIVALSDREITLFGTGSLMNRPVDMVVGPLESLGAICSTNDGKPPLKVKGPLKGGVASVDGSVTSQFLTGLLMALPLCGSDTTLTVTNLKSKDYIRLTIALVKEFGITVEPSVNFDSIVVPGNQKYISRSYVVEGDWSGSAFLLVAGALAGKVSVTHLRADSTQADRAILDALESAGAYVEIETDMITVVPMEKNAFEFDATDCPDLFPPLVALAAGCRGKSIIRGAQRLVHKESNRALTLASEFNKIGVPVEIRDDVIEVTGTKPRGGTVDSHNDHRIAMACAVAALFSESGVTIENSEAVAKSYPEFFDDLASLQVVKR